MDPNANDRPDPPTEEGDCPCGGDCENFSVEVDAVRYYDEIAVAATKVLGKSVFRHEVAAIIQASSIAKMASVMMRFSIQTFSLEDLKSMGCEPDEGEDWKKTGDNEKF